MNVEPDGTTMPESNEDQMMDPNDEIQMLRERIPCLAADNARLAEELRDSLNREAWTARCQVNGEREVCAERDAALATLEAVREWADPGKASWTPKAEVRAILAAAPRSKDAEVLERVRAIIKYPVASYEDAVDKIRAILDGGDAKGEKG